jgi:hypothetical protein
MGFLFLIVNSLLLGEGLAIGIAAISFFSQLSTDPTAPLALLYGRPCHGMLVAL